MGLAAGAVGGVYEAARILAVRLRLPYQANFLWVPFVRENRVSASSGPGGISGLRLLVVGQQEAGGTGRSRLEALRSLAAETEGVNLSDWIQGLSSWAQVQANHFYSGERLRGINRVVLDRAEAFRPDAVWVEKGLHLLPETLVALRSGGCRRLIHFSPDNQRVFGNQSRHYLRGVSLYDAHVTTKTDDVYWLRRLGARRVERMGKGFDPDLHRPQELDAADRERFGCQVGFVGHWEPWREELLLDLFRRGYTVKVWGGGWSRARRRKHPLFAGACQLAGPEYAKAICGAQISLCLLSRWFGDRVTARSVEIPACGGFLLAERTAEHAELFREGAEAEFYGNKSEMLEKIERYLRDENARRPIVRAGRERCLRGYSNAERLQAVLARLLTS